MVFSAGIGAHCSVLARNPTDARTKETRFVLVTLLYLITPQYQKLSLGTDELPSVVVYDLSVLSMLILVVLVMFLLRSCVGGFTINYWGGGARNDLTIAPWVKRRSRCSSVGNDINSGARNGA